MQKYSKASGLLQHPTYKILNKHNNFYCGPELNPGVGQASVPPNPVTQLWNVQTICCPTSLRICEFVLLILCVESHC